MSHPKMPPVVCHDWCRNGDGHPGSVTRQDQVCRSAPASVLTRLERMWPALDGGWIPPTIETWATAGPEVPDAVVLYIEHPDVELELRPEEARHLIDALSAALGHLDLAR